MSKKKTKLPEVGQLAVFTGFTGEVEDNPDFAEYLTKGDSYEVGAFTPGKEETDDDDGTEDTYTLSVANPEYSPDKRKSKNNQPSLGVVVFPDELKLAKDQIKKEEPAGKTEETKKTPAKKQATKKETTKDEEKPEEETEETKPKAKAKAKSKAKPKLKPIKEEKGTPEAVADKDLLILTADEEDAGIREICEESDDICALAREAAEDAHLSDFRLGGIMYHVRASGAYRDADERYAGKKGFGLWSEEVLGIKYRKAMDLSNIYAQFCKHGIGSSTVAQLGWSKCIQIARVMTADNADELVSLAGESTVADLQETIKETYTGGEGTKPLVKKVRFKFALEQDAGTVIAELFTLATESLGLDHDNDVFEHIITEWAAEHLEVAKTKKVKTKTKKAKKSKKSDK